MVYHMLLVLGCYYGLPHNSTYGFAQVLEAEPCKSHMIRVSGNHPPLKGSSSASVLCVYIEVMLEFVARFTVLWPYRTT